MLVHNYTFYITQCLMTQWMPTITSSV